MKRALISTLILMAVKGVAAEPPLPALPVYDESMAVHDGPMLLPPIDGNDTSFDNETAGFLLDNGNEYGPDADETTYYYKLTSSKKLEGDTQTKKEEIYLKARFTRNKVEISPVFEASRWEEFEITNRDPSWKTVKENGVEYRKAVPAMRGVSNTPEALATLAITQSNVGIFRNSGKEGATYFQGSRIRPEIIAQIKEWRSKKELLANTDQRAVITAVTLSPSAAR